MWEILSWVKIEVRRRKKLIPSTGKPVELLLQRLTVLHTVYVVLLDYIIMCMIQLNKLIINKNKNEHTVATLCFNRLSFLKFLVGN